MEDQIEFVGGREDNTARRAEIVKCKIELAKLAKTEKDLYERAYKGQTDFLEETAAKTGKSKRAVGRDKRRGEKIIPEVKDAIKDMPAADSGVELDAIASLEPDEQKQAVKRVKSGASKNFRGARDFIKGDEPSPAELEFEVRDHGGRANVSDQKLFVEQAEKTYWHYETPGSEKAILFSKILRATASVNCGCVVDEIRAAAATVLSSAAV